MTANDRSSPRVMARVWHGSLGREPGVVLYAEILGWRRAAVSGQRHRDEPDPASTG